MPLILLLSALLPLLSVHAYIRMSCPSRLVRNRLDPIVVPGGVAGHVHTICGGSAFNPNLTYAQARTSVCSSCAIKEDLSNYWTPQLYFRSPVNGSFFAVNTVGDAEDERGGMVVYYLQRHEPDEQLFAFPPGFRMIAGDSTKRSYAPGGAATDAISFACLGTTNPETTYLPPYNCPYGLRAQAFFPACWNGRDLDSGDHRSHVSYPLPPHYDNGPCPSDYPVHLISLFYEVLYDTNRFAGEWNGSLGDPQPFVFSNGDPSGYGFHADFVNGWDVNVLQNVVSTCTDDSGTLEKCPAVSLFTGDEMSECQLPTVVNETVDGEWLEKLPGCNPVTFGPENVPNFPPHWCNATSELSPPIGNFIDLTSAGWRYAGCGTDVVWNRTLSGAQFANDHMTVEACVYSCNATGFRFAGLEYARECYCGDDLVPGRAPRQGVYGNCDMRCMGDKTEFCGDAGRISLYERCDDGSLGGETGCRNEEFGIGGSDDDEDEEEEDDDDNDNDDDDDDDDGGGDGPSGMGGNGPGPRPVSLTTVPVATVTITLGPKVTESMEMEIEMEMGVGGDGEEDEEEEGGDGEEEEEEGLEIGRGR